MPVDAIILDVDGTVATCPYDFDAMRAAVRSVAVKWGVDITTLEVDGIIEQIAQIADGLAERGPAFRTEAEQAVVALEVAAARHAQLLPGAGATLAELRHQGSAIALITRNCRAAADIVLQGLREYDLLLTRDDVPHPKPHPNHVLRCLTALRCSPHRSAVVGDHPYDMQAGRAADVQFCIGVRTGNSSDSALHQAGAHTVLDSIADLPRWLSSHQESSP